MIVSNFNLSDAFTFLGFTSFAGVAAFLNGRLKGIIIILRSNYFIEIPVQPSTLAACLTVGASLGFTAAAYDSENRLQGYLANEQDVLYWTDRLKKEREAKESTGFLQSTFGVSKVNVEELEKTYLK